MGQSTASHTLCSFQTLYKAELTVFVNLYLSLPIAKVALTFVMNGLC